LSTDHTHTHTYTHTHTHTHISSHAVQAIVSNVVMQVMQWLDPQDPSRMQSHNELVVEIKDLALADALLRTHTWFTTSARLFEDLVRCYYQESDETPSAASGTLATGAQVPGKNAQDARRRKYAVCHIMHEWVEHYERLPEDVRVLLSNFEQVRVCVYMCACVSVSVSVSVSVCLCVCVYVGE
jgi:hypothetical protein